MNMYAGNVYYHTEDLRKVIEELLELASATKSYRVYTDRSGLFFDIHWISAHSPFNSKTWNVATKDLQQLILFAKNDNHAGDMIKDYLWEVELPVGFNKKEVPTCTHEWTEVVMFNTVQERCKHCDIKRT